jgi:hypothetical protein
VVHLARLEVEKLTTTWKQKRGQLAGLTRVLPPDDPKLTELRRDIKAERLAEHVKKVVDGWPKLTDAQLNDVAALLRVGSA